MKKRVVIHGGRVHDVGYRPFPLGVAESLGIERFSADNLFVEGAEAVEVLVEDEEDKVKVFLDTVVKRRPERAIVEKVDVYDYAGNAMETEAYYCYLTSTQLSKMAEYGGVMIVKQEETSKELRDYREEFQNLRTEFRGCREEFRDFARRTDENFGLMSERYGEISEKLTVIPETLVRGSRETREMLNETMRSPREALDKFLKSAVLA